MGAGSFGSNEATASGVALPDKENQREVAAVAALHKWATRFSENTPDD